MNDIYKERLKNKIYSLLCVREEGGEWLAFLDSLLVECVDLIESSPSASYYALYAKLSALRYLSFEYFRKTIFECMNLLSGGKN